MELRDWWNQCKENFAHLSLNHDWIHSEKKNRNNPRSLWLSNIDWKGKSVVDYGPGGGFGGAYLFEKGISKYIGLDVSDRSLKEAELRLRKFQDKCEFHRVDSFSREYIADVFLTHAVIQHFPTEEYTRDFFEELNKSKIPELCVQFRFSPTVKFNSKSYNFHEGEVKYACRLNLEYVRSNLSNYSLAYSTDPNPNTDYVYTIWRAL